MQTTIRNYRPTDREHLARCLNSLGDYMVRLDPWHRLTRTPDYGTRYATVALRQTRAKHGFILVAEADREPAGIAVAWTPIASGPDRTAELPTKVGWIWGLAVLPAWRGRGIGTRLLRECEQRFRVAGCDQLSLGTFARHRRGLRLYSRQGYEPRNVLLGKRIGPPRHRWPSVRKPLLRQRGR